MHYSLVFQTISEDNTGTPVSAVPSLREMVAKALSEEASLPVDLQSLNFEPGSQITVNKVCYIFEIHVLHHCCTSFHSKRDSTNYNTC